MNTRQAISHATLALIIFLVTNFSFAQDATPSIKTNSRVAAVWKMEELYWSYVKAGDVDSYRTLFDEGFRGWPCKLQGTSTKAQIGDWVRDIKDQKVKLTYSLTYEGAADFGDIVVVYYKTPMIYEYTDGRIVDRDVLFKFTHTWQRTGQKWHIIGGMCGQLPPAPNP